jgi:hypothetical protein
MVELPGERARCREFESNASPAMDCRLEKGSDPFSAHVRHHPLTNYSTGRTVHLQQLPETP